MSTEHDQDPEDWFVEGPFRIAKNDTGHALIVAIDNLCYCWAIYKFKGKKGEGVDSGFFCVNASVAAHRGMLALLDLSDKHVRVSLAPSKPRAYKRHVRYTVKSLKKMSEKDLREGVLDKALPQAALDMFKGVEEAVKNGPPLFNKDSDTMKFIFSAGLHRNPPE